MANNFTNSGLSSLAVTFADVYTPSAVKSIIYSGLFTNKSVSTVKAYLTRQLIAAQTFAQVWQVDDTPAGNAFVDETADANSATDADFQPFLAGEAIGDYCSFGMTDRFGTITFDYLNGTAGVGGVVAWEYWNGSAWTALSNVTDNTTGFTAAVADGLTVTWDIPANWATLTENSSAELYFVRARVTTVYSTNPVLDQATPSEAYRNEMDGIDVPVGSSLIVPKMTLLASESIQAASDIADSLDVSINILEDVS